MISSSQNKEHSVLMKSVIKSSISAIYGDIRLRLRAPGKLGSYSRFFIIFYVAKIKLNQTKTKILENGNQNPRKWKPNRAVKNTREIEVQWKNTEIPAKTIGTEAENTKSRDADDHHHHHASDEKHRPKQEKNRDRGGDDNHRSRDEKNGRRRSREYSQDHERSHEPKAERAMEVREAPAVEGRRRLRPESDDGGRRREGIGRWRAATRRRRRNQY
ncbi:hypothetical protein U1Q18_022306 [Sarracenia purpurea var. burkii]